MYRVFVDHSGDIYYPKGLLKGEAASRHKGSTRHLSMVAVRFDERALVRWSESIRRILSTYFPDRNPADTEIHTIGMLNRHREAPWDEISGPDLPQVIDEVRDALLASGMVAYGHVFNKEDYWNYFPYKVPEDPGPNAIRHLFKRIDRSLQRSTRPFAVTFDEDSSPVRNAFAAAIADVQANGDSLDPSTPSISNLELLESYEWVDSRDSRGLQAADFLAYWLQKAAEHGAANRLREMDGIWHTAGPVGREPWVFPPNCRAMDTIKGTHEPEPYDGPGETEE